MNSAKEKCFCDNFLEKRIKDRIFYELNLPQKRRDAIHRFSHTIENIVRPTTILLKSSKITENELLKESRKVSTSSVGYILSEDNDLDGKEFSLEEAISRFFYLGFGAVIVVDEKTAILKDEQCYGPSTKYVLHI